MIKKFPIITVILVIGLFLIPGIGSISPAFAQQSDKELPESALDGIDAVQAVAIANKWRYTHKEISSAVTTREVIFRFPDKNKNFKSVKRRERRIPLPDDKMVIAVAPFIKQTHR